MPGFPAGEIWVSFLSGILFVSKLLLFFSVSGSYLFQKISFNIYQKCIFFLIFLHNFPPFSKINFCQKNFRFFLKKNGFPKISFFQKISLFPKNFIYFLKNFFFSLKNSLFPKDFIFSQKLFFLKNLFFP